MERFLPAGDSAVTVELGGAISSKVNARVRSLQAAVESAGIPGIRETVPAYCSLTVHYDPCQILFGPLVARLRELTAALDAAAATPYVVVELPVLYGGEFGPDLGAVARFAGKSEQEVIALHSEVEYLIYMLGFTPGFPYLGGLNPAIAAPRLETPRLRIPAGSVGIAGSQTGVYPVASPGGWQLIGRTPVSLYDPARPEPILLRAGEYVKFRPIDGETYRSIAAQGASYVCRRSICEEVGL
ncbi:5-oxoprolinase subunit PxpB [Oscillibacter sp. MSJ-2]|uniref:5-oxoprolinase subunit PxpB n=1 Tax=Dysosmobacter acutus TaxID=2841504 RepID=A0ABS6F9E6_9FIRM|nr:5-oxoprolinase subunit PxpB [Dysosmobacter acutus]MBU5625929.1 5-oxoprolinase subunit PxpB [Dysosmobacter acutus]